MDPRLIVKTGKKGKTTFIKSPCVGECAGCPKQFKPVPPEDGKTFCLVYPEPAAKWAGLNSDGKPKTCPFMYKAKAEKEQKINPIKASRRRIKQTSPVTVTAVPEPVQKSSKESKKKNKEKAERRDSR